MHQREHHTTAEVRRSIVADNAEPSLPYLGELGIARQQGPERLASLVRQKFVKDAGALAITESIVEFYDWGLKYHSIGDGTRVSTVRALLIPMLVGGFTVSVNTDHDYGTNEADVHAALIAHELAHTYSYNCDTVPPKRKTPFSAIGNVQDEIFCDAFALGLTGFDLRAINNKRF